MKDLSIVLEETFRKYSTCLTYSDKGSHSDNSGWSTIQFSTHFKRPKSIRFEWSGETNITRQGFVPDAAKSTVLRCDAKGVCTYFDPRNTEEPELHFPSLANMFREDSMLSGSVTDVIPPLLTREFGLAPKWGKKAFRKIEKIDGQEGYPFCAERSYMQYSRCGAATVTDTIWIDENFQIGRFRHQIVAKAVDKRISKFISSIYKNKPGQLERHLAKDDIFVDDYHFSDVSFDKDIDDALFTVDLDA
jgi:hypothetical protein